MRLNTIVLIAVSVFSVGASAQNTSTPADANCSKPVYLTLDTGHMGVAQQIADVLRAEHVKVTFFAANERTKVGDGSLGDFWAPWWKARANEGHAFASHTWDHTYWRGDTKTGFTVRPSQGPRAGQSFAMTVPQYCAEIKKSDDRLQQITGVKPLPLFRAPGGKTSV
ncbi:MAG: polysaccharide deacetylase family protein, partial [Comamonas sp.]